MVGEEEAFNPIALQTNSSINTVVDYSQKYDTELHSAYINMKGYEYQYYYSTKMMPVLLLVQRDSQEKYYKYKY